MEVSGKMKIKRIIINICEDCLEGKGSECHTPGCALYLHRVDLPINENTYELVDEWEDPDDKENNE